MSTVEKILKANETNLQTLNSLVSENPDLRNTLLYRDFLIRNDFVNFLCGNR